MSDAHLEQRQATPIGSTRDIPFGTLVTVPIAPPRGKTPDAPVVAVETRRWYQSPEILIAGIALPILEMIDEPVFRFLGLTSNFPRHVLVFGLGFYIAYCHAHHHEAIR